jgi:hypothetical protein
MTEGPRLIIKAEQLGLFGAVSAKPAPKPASKPVAPAGPKPPKGFTPIPNSKRGGYHRRVGGKFEYWYPDTGVSAAPHPEESRPSQVKVVKVDPETGKEVEIVSKPKAAETKLVVPKKPEEPASKPSPKPSPKPAKAAPKPKEPVLTVQPGTEEARGKYETTGYVFGSRAELWALRNSGELEKDPALAYKLVTKEAVMGGKIEPASFASEAFAGTRPAAAYLKYRLLQAIQSRPEDTADARDRFSEQIAVVQKSLAELRTLGDVQDFTREVGNQLRGLAPKATFSAEEMKERGWDVLFTPRPKLKQIYSVGDYIRASPAKQVKMRAEEEALNAPDFEIWKSLRQTAREEAKALFGGRVEWQQVGNDSFVAMRPVVAEAHEEAIKNWEALGSRFLAICGYKITYPYRKRGKSVEDLRRRGYVDPERQWNERRLESAWKSDLRANVMGEAEKIQGLDPGTGELDEQGQAALKTAWNWMAETKKPKGPSSKTERTETEEGEKYHTILAQARLGETSRKGPAVPGNAGIGSAMMKKSLGLREVEYGRWVTGKGAKTAETGRERQWHTEAAHAALHDLAHVMGIEPDQMGQKGRLSMSFGSRGGGSHAASYFPGPKVINITKTAGKGSLAHEWGHFMDYMVTHVASPGKGKPKPLSEHAAMGSAAEGVPRDVHSAMRDVMDAIMFEPGSEGDGRREARTRIEELRGAFYRETDREKREQRRLELNAEIKTFNRAARGKGTFKKHTEFHSAAKKMGDYWSRPREMFARCFEAYVADKLEGQGRENTYLVKGTKGNIVSQYPGYFPQGTHRELVVSAMDRLAAALRADDHFQKAMPWGDWFQAVVGGIVDGPALHIPQGRLV